jgi:hypothetical protein
MSTQPDLLEPALAGDIFKTEVAKPQTPPGCKSPYRGVLDCFGDEQIHRRHEAPGPPIWTVATGRPHVGRAAQANTT